MSAIESKLIHDEPEIFNQYIEVERLGPESLTYPAPSESRQSLRKSRASRGATVSKTCALAHALEQDHRFAAASPIEIVEAHSVHLEELVLVG